LIVKLHVVEADFTLKSTLNDAENNQRLIGVLNQRSSASII